MISFVYSPQAPALHSCGRLRQAPDCPIIGRPKGAVLRVTKRGAVGCAKADKSVLCWHKARSAFVHAKAPTAWAKAKQRPSLTGIVGTPLLLTLHRHTGFVSS